MYVEFVLCFFFPAASSDLGGSEGRKCLHLLRTAIRVKFLNHTS